MYSPDEDLPAFYDGQDVQTYRDRVEAPGSYDKKALVVDKDDHEAMLNQTLYQALSRGLDTE
jgi:hypothetical protein